MLNGRKSLHFKVYTVKKLLT